MNQWADYEIIIQACSKVAQTFLYVEQKDFWSIHQDLNQS